MEESQCQLDRDGQALDCFLRTLQSPIGPDGSEVTEVKRLSLRCSDSFFLESTLKNDHFGRLPMLDELSIQYCKLRHLPPGSFQGLTSLTRLSLNSHNADWGQSSVLMEIDRESFAKMNSLEVLDLSANNLWSLPPGALCGGMDSLTVLNMSQNHLLDVVDLGLGFIDGCLLDSLREIDLSSNHISSLRSGDLRQVSSSLEVLNLKNNRLSILAEDALTSMTKLKDLNLADNQLAAIPPSLFQGKKGLDQLESLHLQNNSLTMMTSNLFFGLTGLLMLNLSHNAISSHIMETETFSGLNDLRVLDLSYNRLTLIEVATFEAMTSLQALELSHNQLHTVNGDTFRGLEQLTILSLSNNIVSSIDKEAFSGLSKLTSLSMDHNKIRYVPDIFLDGKPGPSLTLEDLSFNSNELVEVPGALKHLPNLRTLDLGENDIEALEAGDFGALVKLYGLRLAGNSITEVKKVHFGNITGIHVLNLAHNRLTSIERGAFDSLGDLRALRLDNNRLTDINGLVSSLAKLQWFNVSSNRYANQDSDFFRRKILTYLFFFSLQWFDYAFVPKSLEWLDIQNNEVEELGNYYKLRSDFNLKRLDASGNLIRSLNKLSLPASIEHVALNRNAIRHIAAGVFEDKPNLNRVELVDNEINHLKLSALSVGRVSSKGKEDFTRAIKEEATFFTAF